MNEQGQSVIICGVDGSGHGQTAVRVAADLAQALDATLALVAVNWLSPASGHPDIRSWTAEEQDAVLHQALAEARGRCSRVQAVATQGRDVADALIDSARQLGGDHIVVGSGDRKGLVDWLMGSVARSVAARAPFSVTIAR